VIYIRDHIENLQATTPNCFTGAILAKTRLLRGENLQIRVFCGSGFTPLGKISGSFHKFPDVTDT
jgi:hypothetical protein